MTIQDRTAPTAAESDCATVFVAIELSRSSWVVAAHTPPVDKIRLHKLAAGDVEGLLALISRRRARAEKALGRPVRVASCYEAGYDAFWLHRVLVANDVDSQVIDPASLLVNRRARRAKSDRIDAEGMLRALMAYARGERRVFAVVRVPSRAEEDFNLDTPGGRFIEGLDPPASYAALERNAPDAVRGYRSEAELRYLVGPGVSAAALWTLREALDAEGFDKVKIVASSGFGPAKCRVMAVAQAPIDVVGTGSYLPEVWPETYATADIVAYNGEPRVKVGREFLLKKD